MNTESAGNLRRSIGRQRPQRCEGSVGRREKVSDPARGDEILDLTAQICLVLLQFRWSRRRVSANRD